MTMAEIMPYFNISIHAPREGCDIVRLAIRNDDHRISIHAPREGCDSVTLSALYCVLGFQSTHPVRGATHKRRKLPQR